MVTETRLSQKEFDVELEALTENMLAESTSWLITQKQVTTLASMMSAGLQDKSRENRLNVLRILCQDAVFTRTGYAIQSTKQIPGEFASVLIDLLKVNEGWELSDYGRQLLLLAEERAKAGANQDED